VQLTLTDHGAEIALRAAGIVRQLQEELAAPIGGTTSHQHRELARTLRALLGLPHPSGTQKQGEPMTTGPALTGQDIGAAAEAVKTLLDNAAASVGRSASEFVALRVLALRGPITPPSDLRDFLAQQRQFGLDQAGVAEVLAGLEGQGLVSGTLKDGSGPAQLTDAGRAAFGQLGAAVAATSDRLYAGMDQQDLAAARRVLAEVTERAKGLNAV
jgi:DNA-binding MarR family transcriptional regulator